MFVWGRGGWIGLVKRGVVAGQGHSLGVVHAVALQIRGWWGLLVVHDPVGDAGSKTGGVIGVSGGESVGIVFSGRSWGVVDGGWKSWGQAQALWGLGSCVGAIEGQGGVHRMAGGRQGRYFTIYLTVLLARGRWSI